MDLGHQRCMVLIWKVVLVVQCYRHLANGCPTGSLFTDETKSWNVAHLPSLLNRLLPSSSNGLPGVNTPYLYFGMWRATFAWHVEDMDLFSINYIHFGAGKFWYAVPQARASALEQTMRGETSGRSTFSIDCVDLSHHRTFPRTLKVFTVPQAQELSRVTHDARKNLVSSQYSCSTCRRVCHHVPKRLSRGV